MKWNNNFKIINFLIFNDSMILLILSEISEFSGGIINIDDNE